MADIRDHYAAMTSREDEGSECGQHTLAHAREQTGLQDLSWDGMLGMVQNDFRVSLDVVATCVNRKSARYGIVGNRRCKWRNNTEGVRVKTQAVIALDSHYHDWENKRQQVTSIQEALEVRTLFHLSSSYIHIAFAPELLQVTLVGLEAGVTCESLRSNGTHCGGTFRRKVSTDGCVPTGTTIYKR
jgi:hypothetical protein